MLKWAKQAAFPIGLGWWRQGEVDNFLKISYQLGRNNASGLSIGWSLLNRFVLAPS
jgi:hypothetical protein